MHFDIGDNVNACKNRSKFTLLHLNIRCLSAKFDSLKQFLCELENCNPQPDFVLLCETWLNDTSSNYYTITGYNLVEKQRETTREGGVCVFVKTCIHYIGREDLRIFGEGRFESVFIELVCQKYCYWRNAQSPRHNLGAFMETYKRIIKTIVDKSKLISTQPPTLQTSVHRK